MKFGLFTVFDNYHNISHRTVSQMYDEVLEQTCLADELGYDAVWFAEHHFHEYGVAPSPHVLLGAASRLTKRIRLGVSVVVLPLHNPIRVAEDYLTVDALSGGRLNLGLGSGYLSREFSGFRVPFDDKPFRFNDALDLLQKAWTGQEVTHSGQYYSARNLQLNVPPIQAPFPPYWVATLNRRAIPFVAKMGHKIMGIAYVNSSSRLDLASVIRTYKDMYSNAGFGEPDELEIPVAFHVHVAESSVEAEANATDALNLYLKTRQYGRDLSYADLYSRQQAIVGNPDEIIAHIRAYEEIGVTHFMALMNFGNLKADKVKKSMELFSHFILPEFRNQSRNLKGDVQQSV